MHLRPLTDEEIDMIRQAKKQAEVYLRPQRNKARRKLKTAMGELAIYVHKQDLEAVKPITGMPIRIYNKEDPSEYLFVDYDNLQKLLRSLDEQQYDVYTKIGWNSMSTKLYITYVERGNPKNHGRITLWGISKVYDDVLRSVRLPAIAI